jgi:diguanylate cyclase (GGDEF)-like protein
MGKERETFQDMMREARSKERSGQETSDTIEIEIAPLAEQMANAGREGRRPFLIIFDGMSMGTHIQLDENPIVLGRDASCDVVIADSGISRRHAQLQLNERNRLSVRDLGSTNGIFVKGKRVENATVTAGTKMLFGQRTLAKFVLEDPLDRVYEETLWSSCTRDALTGISNRDYLRKRIQGAHSFAKRHQVPYSLTLFCVDNLVEINRVHGMQVGDQSLVVVVRVISDIIREEDVFSRFARDELAILSTGCDLIGAMALATRVLGEVAKRRVAIPDSEETTRISLAAGISTVFNNPEVTTEDLLERALENLEKAKGMAEGEERVVASHVV